MIKDTFSVGGGKIICSGIFQCGNDDSILNETRWSIALLDHNVASFSRVSTDL